jgi:hypothetical protein
MYREQQRYAASRNRGKTAVSAKPDGRNTIRAMPPKAVKPAMRDRTARTIARQAPPITPSASNAAIRAAS